MALGNLMWRTMLCGAGDAASPWDAREGPRTPHNFNAIGSPKVNYFESAKGKGAS